MRETFLDAAGKLNTIRRNEGIRFQEAEAAVNAIREKVEAVLLQEGVRKEAWPALAFRDQHYNIYTVELRLAESHVQWLREQESLDRSASDLQDQLAGQAHFSSNEISLLSRIKDFLVWIYGLISRLFSKERSWGERVNVLLGKFKAFNERVQTHSPEDKEAMLAEYEALDIEGKTMFDECWTQKVAEGPDGDLVCDLWDEVGQTDISIRGGLGLVKTR